MDTSISFRIKEIVIYPDGRMDSKNTSAYTGLSEKTHAMMRCNGTGPKFIKRGRIFYFKDDLDVWLNEGGRFTSTSQAQRNTCLKSQNSKVGNFPNGTRSEKR